MTISKTIEGNVAVFSIEGRLDTITSGDAQVQLLPAFDENPSIVLDMVKTTYVSSAGLRVLIQAQKTASSKKGSFALRGVSSEIMEVISMTGLDKVLKFI